ncbi:MAG: Hsp33 family molecular chaperone [Rhodospirillaceae bacterium]|nr:Hsp33 family molecular chaperone [Rhodospirillaceae bacterium]
MNDEVHRFQLEAQAVRGRLVRLGPLVSSVIERHDYPEPVAALLSEMVTLAIVLASGLKYEGVFTLQTNSKGPVRLIVADVTSAGEVRGYAQFDAARVDAVVAAAGSAASVPRLLGPGYLAFTVDQGPRTQRYQGIVELTGATLVDCVQHYFRQSEQLETGIRMAVSRAGEGTPGWRAGAIMLQRMPASGVEPAVRDGEEDSAAGGPDESADDDWRRALMLLATASNAELLDPALEPNDLLYRLFHEEGVRVFRPRSLRPGCRCSRERVERVLRSLTADELSSLEEEDGAIVATCEFCNTRYRFTREDVAWLTAGRGAAGPRPQ